MAESTSRIVAALIVAAGLLGGAVLIRDALPRYAPSGADHWVRLNVRTGCLAAIDQRDYGDESSFDWYLFPGQEEDCKATDILRP